MELEKIVDSETLKEICSMTVQLTKMRQNECSHLCIENYAPELFGKLIDEYIRNVSIKIEGGI